MIKAELTLPDGRIIVVRIKEKAYKRLTFKLQNLSFWEKIKLLFKS